MKESSQVQPHLATAFAIVANSSCVRNVDSSAVSVVLWSRYFLTASSFFTFSSTLMKRSAITIKSVKVP